MNHYDIYVKNNLGNRNVKVRIITRDELSEKDISNLNEMRIADIQKLYKGHVVVLGDE